MNERDLLPRRAAHNLAPFAMVLVLIFTVVMLCSSNGRVLANDPPAQHSMSWSVDRSLSELKTAGDNAQQRRRALVALHRNARVAIAEIERVASDPSAREEALRLLADIERELAKVERR